MAAAVGEAVAVTLVGQDSYKRLCQAATQGYCVLDDGTKISATQYFRTLGLPFGLFLAASLDYEQADWLGLVIINGLPDPLTFLDNTSLSHCFQTHYPTESDLVGFWSDMANKNQSPPADLSSYPQSDLATFYSRTAGKSGGSISKSQSGAISITAGFGTAGDDEKWFVDDGIGDAPWNVMIVDVRPQ